MGTLKTWGELVLWTENRSAVKAARRVTAVLANTAKRRTFACPLYLHGATGTGKSAILSELIRDVTRLKSHPSVQLLQASELPRASKDDAAELLELKTCDLLAIEDVHRLKKTDVEALIQLLDHRLVRRAPTVFTASAGPANLPNVPRRLSSRCGMGLVVQLQSPGVASRRKLIRHICGLRKLRLSTEAIAWLALGTNGLRVLLGQLETLRSTVKASAHPLTALQVQDSLARSEQTPQPGSVLQCILEKVGALYGLKPKELIGKSRLQVVVRPRQVAMYLANKVLKRPLKEIGKTYGGRDHTTVLSAVRKIAALRKADSKLEATLRELASGL